MTLFLPVSVRRVLAVSAACLAVPLGLQVATATPAAAAPAAPATALPCRVPALAVEGTRFGCARPIAPSPALKAALATGVSAATDVPSQCLAHAYTGWWVERFRACDISSWNYVQIQVRDGVPVIVGHVDYNQLSYTYMNATLSVWGHLFQIQPVDVGGTAVDSALVDAHFRCDGNCTVENEIPFPPTFAVRGKTVTGEAISASTTTGAGQVGIAGTHWTYTWSWIGSGSPPTEPVSDSPPGVRCDNRLPGQSKAGCVIPTVSPVMAYSLSGPYQELAAHIAFAQGSGLPGRPNGTPLTRLVDAGLQELNRAVACPDAWPRPSGKSCDEYPFASTRQGAFTGGGTGRTFPGCTVPLPSSTGPTGYSSCMINAEQNTNGGNALSTFYRNNRILDRDAYWVLITA